MEQGLIDGVELRGRTLVIPHLGPRFFGVMIIATAAILEDIFGDHRLNWVSCLSNPNCTITSCSAGRSRSSLSHIVLVFVTFGWLLDCRILELLVSDHIVG